jgi:Na+/H+-dicarboxylate symporter
MRMKPLHAIEPVLPNPTLAIGGPSSGRWRWPPLWLQVAVALALGCAVGVIAGEQPIAGFTTTRLGEMGMIVIRALRALAVPLVAFVVLDALLRFDLPKGKAARLIRVCALNACVAMAIGLTLSHVFRPGDALRALFAPIADAAAARSGGAAGELDPLGGLLSLIPTSVAGPFVDNAALPAALLALLFGAALRSVHASGAVIAAGFGTLRDAVHLISEALQRALGWLVLLTPFAGFALVAAAVGRAGLHALSGLWVLLGVVGLGFVMHGLLYYPLLAWWRGGKSPRVYLGGGRDALVTGIATNSSLATVPVTLRCLTERMQVSEPSARLAACLGTNLNNDGIALYEAMTVIAIAQACGFELDLTQQASVVLASVLAGMGIAGIPEAGIVMLPVVIASVGLPEAAAAAAVPLVMPIDWILARARTALNVLSDMVVAIVVDAPPLKR